MKMVSSSSAVAWSKKHFLFPLVRPEAEVEAVATSRAVAGGAGPGAMAARLASRFISFSRVLSEVGVKIHLVKQGAERSGVGGRWIHPGAGGEKKYNTSKGGCPGGSVEHGKK
jgi:enterochelin esterase-like enzyme